MFIKIGKTTYITNNPHMEINYKEIILMKQRMLGKTNLMVSEIGFGGEWLERHPEEESV